MLLASGFENLPAEFGFRAKVKDQAYFDAGCFEVIQELGLMPWSNGISRFDFEDDEAVDGEIGKVITNDDAIVRKP